MVVIHPETTRGELVTCLLHFCDQARRELRYDNLGRPNIRWAALHADMDALLTAILEADDLARTYGRM